MLQQYSTTLDPIVSHMQTKYRYVILFCAEHLVPDWDLGHRLLLHVHQRRVAKGRRLEGEVLQADDDAGSGELAPARPQVPADLARPVLQPELRHEDDRTRH